MLPFTNAPRLPNIGLTSTPGASRTIARKRALSSSLCFGICISPSNRPGVGPATSTRGLGCRQGFSPEYVTDRTCGSVT